MKIYSDYKELEGEIFRSVADCEAAEAAVEKQREAAKEKDNSKLRKKLSTEVEKTEELVQKAYSDYDEAKKEAQKILEEAMEKAGEILKSAKVAIQEAEKTRTEAIVKFNEACGPYQKIYTGDRAAKEMARVNAYIDSVFNNFWNALRF